MARPVHGAAGAAGGTLVRDVVRRALRQHGPRSLAVLCLVRSLLALERRPHAAAIGVGSFAGLAIAIRPNDLARAGPLLIAGPHRRPRCWLAIILPAMVVLAPVAAYNELVFGRLLGADALEADGLAVAYLPRGMLGSLLNPGRGLLIGFPAPPPSRCP